MPHRDSILVSWTKLDNTQGSRLLENLSPEEVNRIDEALEDVMNEGRLLESGFEYVPKEPVTVTELIKELQTFGGEDEAEESEEEEEEELEEGEEAEEPRE
jgi:hypothetical protein